MIEIKRHKQIGVLFDPDKTPLSMVELLCSKLNEANPDYILVGGSTTNQPIENLVVELKQHTGIPIVLFPGDCRQFTSQADALLLLSLISGRNPKYLIEQHITAARAIRQSGIKVIPTGYILIDGGKISTTQRVSQSEPIKQNDINLIISTAIAGELLGMKAIYLEAGSGAQQPVGKSIISAVRENISIPLIVGGGIKSLSDISNALTSGADLIVVGNHFEQNPEDIIPFCQYTHKFNLD